MKHGLEQAVSQIKEQGFPTKDHMRAEIAEHEMRLDRGLVQKRLVEYTELFNRFKAGDQLTDKETERMSSLSDELTRLSNGGKGAEE